MGGGRRLAELEGLRGLMAWWVVVAHLLVLSGVRSMHPLIRFLRDGDAAVLVFVMLSGFVIFALLDRRDLTFGQFMVRRALRLYPVFLVCFVAAVALFPLERENWQSHLHAADRAALYARTHAMWQEHFASYVIASLAFLHGVVPARILPGADYAFLMPGWSISLEWQFYAIAPVLFAAFDARRRWVWVTGAVAFAAVALFGKQIAWNSSALPAYLRYFGVGIASYYAWRDGRGVRWQLAAAAYIVALPFLDVALRIWCLVVLVLCTETPGAARVRALLTSRPAVALGRVSYSTYLVHWPVLTLYTAAHLHHVRLSPLAAAALGAVVAVPSIYLVSVFLFRVVEAPGIALARRLTTVRRGASRLRSQRT